MSDLYLIPPSAHDLAVGLARVAATYSPEDTFNLNVGANVPNLALSVDGAGGSLEQDPRLVAFVNRTEGRAFIEATTGLLKLGGNSVDKVALHYIDDDNGGYRFRLESGANVDGTRITDSIARHFKLLPRHRMLGESLAGADQEAIRFKEAVVGELGATVSQLGTFLLDRHKQQEEHVQRITDQLQAKYDEREKTLELRSEKERAALSAEREEHARKVGEYETRGYTFVRRDIDTKLETLLGKWDTKVDVVEATAGKRKVIHVLCGAVLIASGTLCGLLANKLAGMQTVSWFNVTPFTAGAVTFVSTLIFYLKWNNAWFSRLAEAEFAQRKNQVDIARASWLAELLFEWKERKEIGLPDDVLRSLTNNLFEPLTWKQDGYHPMDQIVSIIRRSKRVKVGNLEVENRGRRPKPTTGEA